MDCCSSLKWHQHLRYIVIWKHYPFKLPSKIRRQKWTSGWISILRLYALLTMIVISKKQHHIIKQHHIKWPFHLIFKFKSTIQYNDTGMFYLNKMRKPLVKKKGCMLNSTLIEDNKHKKLSCTNAKFCSHRPMCEPNDCAIRSKNKKRSRPRDFAFSDLTAPDTLRSNHRDT